ncbi:DUF2851 family protein [Aliifodinibius sp. S!AR15-10]|uniref:DUF2851 family protein n=1 Tax=Aliifodinibius sp. S!AR15-10 TaxID=2950437 RepID=UPI002860109F|nr:DUF2851 family protein [Aliifodinibius sp. S!AR15-10]MDR8393118.1 DUF2851 family protein [Aliifodinibius sp. S!AR15-10]
MKDLDKKYHERLLHWIWESLYFELNGLETTCGKPITIWDEGELNHSDGPDFKNVRLQIGDLQWHGDIEFHWSITEWNSHKHNTDPGYNQVVLHVVYHDPGNKTVRREDGSTPFTLHLGPYLPANLEKLLFAFNQTDELPCSGHIKYISQEAIEQQFEHAQCEYFETKVDFLLRFYDPSLPTPAAWKRVFTLGLFDGLGISLNREPMLKMGKQLWSRIHDQEKSPGSVQELQARALQLGGFHEKSPAVVAWNHKGCRPTNHPELRLKQAVTLLWHVFHQPLNHWYSDDPKNLWSDLLKKNNTKTGIGRERNDILFGIVFLPALWLLGNLFHKKDLKQASFQHWMNHHAQLPSSLFKLFAHSDIPSELYEQRLGAVHQLKHYCRPRRCNQCKVLKEIISS